MNPSLFFVVLRARFGLFLLALGATLLASLAASLLMAKSYRATASLVVDRRESQSLTEALSGYVSPQERTAYLQTQVDIIRSPKVAREVVDKLELAKRPLLGAGFDKAGGGALEDRIADGIAQNLEVETSQSSVIHISYNANDPADAATMANAFAQAYMDTTLALRVEPTRHAAAWFDEQLQTLRQDLETAQRRMTEYQQQHGIVSADEKMDDEFAQLTALSAQLLRTQEQNVELQARAQRVRLALDRGAALDDIPEVRADAGIQDLKASVIDGEAKLGVLAARYGENHPEYQRQLTENRVRRRALNTEMSRVASATASSVREGESRATQIGNQLAAQRARLLDLKQDRDGLAVLMRNVNTAQTAYDTAMQRFVENQVESRASQSNATLLNPAVAPRRPHRPNVPLNLALALVVGVMLGIALVMLREMTDRRVHSVMELAEAAHAPVLGDLVAWTPAGRPLLSAPLSASGALIARSNTP